MPNRTKTEDSRDILQAAREDSRRRILRRLLAKSCVAAMIVGILNFILFLAGTFYLGGDAVNGRAEHGTYYVWGYSLRDHAKKYREVSRSAYEYSRWHVYIVLVTWPLMLLAGLVHKRLPPEL